MNCFTPFSMRRFVLVALLGLGGCQMAPVTDESSPHSRITVGSTIVLHEPVSVPPGHARIFLQDGQVRIRGRVNLYSPHCNFELSTLSDGPQIIRPGRFTVTALSWDQVEIVQYGEPRMQQVLSLEGGGDPVNPVSRLIHHRLDAPQQPELRRLTCHGGLDDPWRVRFPSVAQIRHALGSVATVEIP